MNELCAKETEKTIVSSCIIAGEIAAEAVDLGLSAEDFTTVELRECWRAIESCVSDGITPDPAVIISRLKTTKTMPTPQTYIAELISDAIPTLEIAELVRVIKTMTTKRRIVSACKKIISLCHKDDEDATAETIVDAAQATLYDAVSNSNAAKQVIPIADCMSETLNNIQAYFSPNTQSSWLKTGYYDIDKLIGGLYAGDLVIVAGRPSMGKSSFALAIALHAAANHKKVLIFTPEMTIQQVIERAISMTARIDLSKMRSGTLPKNSLETIAQTAISISTLPLMLDQTGGITVNQIRTRVMRHAPDIVLIDYLQLVGGHENKESREQQLSAISLAIKNLAKKCNIPIILVSQLNREVERRSPPIPMLSDLHGSGAIEQNADTVFLLYRPEYYGIVSDEYGTTKNRADVIVAKQRNGPTGYVSLQWNGCCTRFDNRYTRS